MWAQEWGEERERGRGRERDDRETMRGRKEREGRREGKWRMRGEEGGEDGSLVCNPRGLSSLGGQEKKLRVMVCVCGGGGLTDVVAPNMEGKSKVSPCEALTSLML